MNIFERPPRSTLEEQLQEVEENISSHPFSDRRIVEANSLVDSMEGADKEEIERLLASQDLPSLEELGKITASGTYSWWKLNRDKRKLIKKIEKIS